MLRFSDLALRRGPLLLFSGATFQIHPTQKVGLVGRNGTGKSSLMALIRGEIGPDAGEFDRPPGWVIAHVRQDTPALDMSALDYVLDGDPEYRRVEAALARAEPEQQAALHDAMHAIDGYTAVTRASELLYGLGFAHSDSARKVAEFSGGWRMRLNLAQALMCRSDLLLLDEPTNHLDLDAVLWLEAWLKRYPGTLILISHDRDILDAVTSQTLHLDNGKAVLFQGSYSDFERKRAEQLAQEQQMRERIITERARLQGFIDRFKAKASKARQAQSRVKALARLGEIAPLRVDSPYRFSFPSAEGAPDPLLVLDDCSVGYAQRPLLANVKLRIAPGQRIGLLGRNGAGKSTLIKLITGRLPALSGERRINGDIRIALFAQHQVDELDPAASPQQILQRIRATASDQEIRNFLGAFGFAGDRATEPCGPRSGGEKARLALAALAFTEPHVMLLDEPTNHLDMDMRSALEDALQAYAGAIVLVSHDRELLRNLCDEFLLVDNGRVSPFDGDLEDYVAWLASNRTRANGSKEEAKAAPAGLSAAQKRSQLQPLRNELKRIEQRMGSESQRFREIEDRLADTAIYDGSNAAELQKLLAEQEDLARRIAESEHRWFECQSRIEEIEAP
jgi:ATP-binding cassette subfamily F protein 3